MPYFSVSGNFKLYSQDYQNTTVGAVTNLTDTCRGTLPARPQILFLSITRLNELRNRNLTLLAILWSRTDETGACPQGFVKEERWSSSIDRTTTNHRKQLNMTCLQWRTAEITFIDFIKAEWEYDIDYNGPMIQSQYVTHTMWDLSSVTNQTIHMQAFILDYGYTSTKYTLRMPCKDVDNDTNCDVFFERLANYTDNQVPYASQDAICAADEHCAAIVRLGTQQCHDNYFYNPNYKRINDSECKFTLRYMVFDELPSIYTHSNMWTYNVVALVACASLWLICSIFAARRWHRSYLRCYKLKSKRHNVYALEENIVYDLRLQMHASPFSEYMGHLCLRDQSDFSILYKVPIKVEFGAEDVPDTEISYCLQKFVFEVDHPVDSCECLVEWDGEFEIADFKSPLTIIRLKRKRPRTVGATNALFLMPLISFQQVFTNYPRRKMFVRIAEYRLLSFYIFFVHLSWMLAVGFLFLINISSIEDSLYGYVSQKPSCSLIFYSLFLACVASTSLSTLIYRPLWRRRHKKHKTQELLNQPKQENNNNNIEYFALEQ
ncbi:murC [Acrasis kona]|uniref:MurC n=1 Tax=Acrasis kona TaxID=1008807 RepID=A0AAW2YKM2_9EUKA